MPCHLSTPLISSPEEEGAKRCPKTLLERLHGLWSSEALQTDRVRSTMVPAKISGPFEVGTLVVLKVNDCEMIPSVLQ